jgi:2-(1,2-epoxy-1,2-dihydrophenyl)acetyl-CoA isomerase
MSLRFEREGAVAKLTLDRPRVGNAINVPLARALMEAAIECDENHAIRSVLLTGAGRLFCSGGDVGEFAAASDSVAPLLKELTAYLHMAIARFARMGKPLVTAINGPAAGAGMSLAILGDIAIAAETAHFTMAYTTVGLSPDGGSTWLLPRLVGLRRAQEMIMTNPRITAADAVTLGLITRQVADSLLMDEASTIANQLANGPTFAFGKTRNLLLQSFHSSFETQMEEEARAIAESGKSRAGQEGIRAFLEKRTPEFGNQ